jgi:DNA-binding winged helix-turn-helix (wHTH) protein/predicted ATPase
MLIFAPFQLDPVNARLWREEELVSLRPKPFAVLRYLVENPGRLVTKEELTKAVWPGTYVGESSLKGYIRDLREVLADDPAAPRFIETVARRGYCFIAPITTAAQPVATSQFSVVGNDTAKSAQLATGHWQLPTSFVGRETELARLHHWFTRAAHGERQVVFVTGEPGLGKTTVVEAFLQSLLALDASPWVGQGQCIEHYGAGEAYLPVLEALGHLARAADGEQVVEALRRYAPTWLAQMPACVSEEELEVIQRQVHGATQERMLREMAEALEALTVIRPVVLWLEDLQWSDYSTLDLLASVARRRGPARLLVIGTYRPTDVIVSGHPLKGLKQELQLHRQCEELALPFLSETEVAQYLALRFPQHQFPPALAHVLHHSTEGNPLFLINVVDELLRREVITERERQWALTMGVAEIELGVPESLRQMVEQKVERLTREEQRLLEVASVAGATFSAATVAAGLEEKAELVEEHCDELVRREQFLRAGGTERWPDRTVSARYIFQHALYQSVLYGRPTESRRQRIHQRIGVRLEEAYGERVRELAAELSMHFERGQDFPRAVTYLQLAAEHAMQQSAYREAISHLTKGLELLTTLPDTIERTRQELMLQLTLGTALIATKGYGVPAVESIYTRARALYQQVRETPQLFPILMGLRRFYIVRAEHQTARELGEQLLRLARNTQDPAFLLEAHLALGTTFSLAYALTGVAVLHQFRREEQPTQERAEMLMTLSSEHGFPFWLAIGAIQQGWTLTEQGQEEEGIVQMCRGIAAWRATGAEIHRLWFLALLAEAYRKVGQVEQGLSALDEALATVNKTGERYYEAELHRLKGQLTLQKLSVASSQLSVPNPQSPIPNPQTEAEACFHKAIEIARQQSAKSLGLRATTSLARLWQQQGKKKKAQQMLAEIYGWFTEGFDTKDLQEAKALLGELSH